MTLQAPAHKIGATLNRRRAAIPYENLILTRDGAVATITLNRPEVLNALNQDLYRELDEAVSQIEAEEAIRVIIFTGAGERAFSAGADIHELADKARRSVPLPRARDLMQRAWHIGTCAKPTIGALNGLAYGGGAVMASSFDIRVGCQRTSFKFLAASYGRVNSTWSLPMQVGWPVAKELLFTGRVVEAEEARSIGLLNYLVPSGELMAKAGEIASQIAANDPRMVQGIKRLLIQDVGSPWEQMYENELDALRGPLRPTPVLEGFKDFLDRKGRA